MYLSLYKATIHEQRFVRQIGSTVHTAVASCTIQHTVNSQWHREAVGPSSVRPWKIHVSSASRSRPTARNHVRRERTMEQERKRSQTPKENNIHVYGMLHI